MPLGLTYWVKKYGFNKPLLYSVFLGISFILVGAILEDSALIDIGAIICILVLFFSFSWMIIRELRNLVDSDNSKTID